MTTPFHTSFRFDTVVIIDSIPADEDPQSAVWLRDTVLAPLTEAHGGRLRYYRVEHQGDLFAVLADIEGAVRDAGFAPILHIESHGTEDGIALANRDVVPWHGLRSHLTAINRGCRMNLLAVMSMCHGWHLVSQLQPVEPAPVWALIGARYEMFPARLQEAFQAFYTELVTARNGRAALEAMNARHARDNWDLTIETAEIWLGRIWRQYEQDACSPEALRAREDRLVLQFMRQSGYDLRHAIHGRAVARESLVPGESQFNHFRRSFLMLDLFPDNELRFELTYQRCVGLPEPQAPTSAS